MQTAAFYEDANLDFLCVFTGVRIFGYLLIFFNRNYGGTLSSGRKGSMVLIFLSEVCFAEISFGQLLKVEFFFASDLVSS